MEGSMSSQKRMSCYVALSISILCSSVYAGKNYQVFDVRRNLAMNSKDDVYRDYYVNAGTQDGLKTGMILSVYRRDPIFDAYDDIRDDLYAPVGQIRLIHVQRTLSIARLVKVSQQKSQPIVDFRSVMIGDRIDLKSATMGDGGFEEGQGGDGASNQPGTSSPALPATTGAEATTAVMPPNPPAKAPSQDLKAAATPEPSAPTDDKKTAKKVPDTGSLFSEENKPVLNTQ